MICETCGYPHQGDDCPNPACPANPTLSDAHREAIRQRHAEHVAAEAERAERMRLWARSFRSERAFMVDDRDGPLDNDPPIDD